MGPEPKDKCKYGHDMTDESNVKEYKGADGMWRRYCVKCNADRQRTFRSRKEGLGI